MKVDAQMKAMQDMASAAEVVRAYVNTDSARAMTAMLDVLITSYTLDLLHVLPADLVRLQAAIKQTQAIRNVVTDQSQDPPKI